MEATAKTVEAETSSSLFLIELIRLAAVSFNPGRTSQKRSVLAVHKMITYIKNLKERTYQLIVFTFNIEVYEESYTLVKRSLLITIKF